MSRSIWFALLLMKLMADIAMPSDPPQVQASSTNATSTPSAAIDGNRFDSSPGHAWIGNDSEQHWQWQVSFPAPTRIASILQIIGDHEFVLQNAPEKYRWEFSFDGSTWKSIEETATEHELRLYRIHRLGHPIMANHLRLVIDKVIGVRPTLREVEFSDDPNADFDFPNWIVAVNVTHDSKLPGEGQQFIPLAKSVQQELQAQQLWLADLSLDFVNVDPKPTCLFLSGSFRDWCEVDRAHWRGVQEVFRSKRWPIWASCGGAQGLAIVSEYGVESEWDCPHCRDPKNPKTPLYTHIGHKEHSHTLRCGDYDHCVFERGPYEVKTVTVDPTFDGLGDHFTTMESHCGQIDWTPRGWQLLVSNGPLGKTKTQCIRYGELPIYAAQFHIEMEGTPGSSRAIMTNFLRIAEEFRQTHNSGSP